VRLEGFLLAATLALPAVAQQAELAGGPPAMLLVATPQLADPRFRESVVLVLRHGRGGPLGVIVNKPSETRLASVFPRRSDTALAARPLYFGGPLEPQRLIALYRDPQPQPRQALEIADRLWMSQSPALIERVVEQPAGTYKILAGFAGWAPGQLEHEIVRGDWYLLPLDQAALFAPDDDKLWPRLLRQATERRTTAPLPVTPVPAAAAHRAIPA
jgi:putative transcriptional regulator